MVLAFWVISSREGKREDQVTQAPRPRREISREGHFGGVPEVGRPVSYGI